MHYIYKVLRWSLVEEFFNRRVPAVTIGSEPIRSGVVYLYVGGSTGLVDLTTNQPIPRDIWPRPVHRVASGLYFSYGHRLGHGFEWRTAVGQRFLFLPVSTANYRLTIVSPEPIYFDGLMAFAPELGCHDWKTMEHEYVLRCQRRELNPFRIELTGESEFDMLAASK